MLGLCWPKVEPMLIAPLFWPQRDSAVRGYPARRSERSLPVWAETRLPGLGGAW